MSSKRIALAALTLFMGLQSDSGPLIRQLLRSALCSTVGCNSAVVDLGSRFCPDQANLEF
jgi:hypothetical protein